MALYLLLLATPCMGCGGQGHMRQLEQLEAQLDTAPDAVRLALDSIPFASLGDEERALYAILRTQADYKCYVPLTTDTLIRYATTYYNRNRKSYRAAMAWYSLGCVYTELSDDAAAIGAYLHALTLFPDTMVRYYALCHQNLGCHYLECQLYDEAIIAKLTLNSLGRVDGEVFFTSQNTNTLYVKRGQPIGSSPLTAGITCLSGAVQNNSNAAIYASTSGDARVTGTMTAGAVVTSSDYRLKKNIRSLSSSDDCLDKIMGLNVVEFNNIQREFETDGIELTLTDSTEAVLLANDDNKVNWYEDDSPIVNNKHYGLIAQELQKIYPDLVVESQDGYLAINYLEIIPLLIRSVQELKAELDATKGGNTPVYKAQARNTDVTNIDAVVTALYQNAPNPFTESTLVRCDVAEDVVKADLYIYNMNGEQIAEYPVTERGETSITIDGGSLNAGMYLYALIAGGQVIDTKRMILTK